MMPFSIFAVSLKLTRILIIFWLKFLKVTKWKHGQMHLCYSKSIHQIRVGISKDRKNAFIHGIPVSSTIQLAHTCNLHNYAPLHLNKHIDKEISCILVHKKMLDHNLFAVAL